MQGQVAPHVTIVVALQSSENGMSRGHFDFYNGNSMYVLTARANDRTSVQVFFFFHFFLIALLLKDTL